MIEYAKKPGHANQKGLLFCAIVLCLVSWNAGAAPLTSSPSALLSTPVEPRDVARDETTVYPLVVEQLIRDAIIQHPVVLSARLQEKASLEDLSVARLQRYPSLSVQSEASGSGRANIVSVEQPLWNAGRLQARINSAASTSSAHTARTQEVLYETALRVVDAWQALVHAHERAREISVTLKELGKYSDLMQRRVDAKVSPPIDMELVAARTLQVRVDLQSATAGQRIAQSRLTQLLGSERPIGALLDATPIKGQAVRALAALNPGLEDKVALAVNHHPSVRKTAQQSESLRYDLQAQKASQWPEIYARAQKPFATSGVVSTSSNVFVGLRYQPGAGFSSFAQAKSALARLESSEQSIEAMRREIRDQVQTDIEELASTQGRVDVLQQAVASSALVFDSYLRQFVAGRRTWPEVLNAVRENGDNRLSLVDAQALLLGAVYRTRVRMGDLDWQQDLPEVSSL